MQIIHQKISRFRVQFNIVFSLELLYYESNFLIDCEREHTTLELQLFDAYL